MKIAYFGYDLFYKCLEKILKDKSIEVMKIFSFPENEDDKNEKIRALADKNKITFTEKKVSQAELENLFENGCEMIVCAGYAYKIPIQPNMNGINLHPALLPEGRGAWPMPVTILKGLLKTGLTVHTITANFDDGDILAQKEYKLRKNENLETLNLWLTDNSADLIYDCIINFNERFKTAKTQENGEYWKMPAKDDMTFTNDTDIKTVDRIVRAFYGSGCFFINNSTEIKIKKAYVVFDSENETSGNEYKINGGKLIIEQYLSI